METTFYHDGQSVTNDAVKKLKSNMTLDFASSKKGRVSGLLASPDLNMLKLGSPELERLIIQQNGLVTTTPTPTQLMFPKAVTEEQEAYARGFVDALAELHQKEADPSTTMAMEVSTEFAAQAAAQSTAARLPQDNGLVMTTMTSVPTSSFATTTALPGSVMSQPASRTQSPLVYSNPSPAPVQGFKEEPQTVPCLSDSPCLSPIDMDSQERIKLDRKRARNRVAARKCRMRKLERIGRLEERVDDLKQQNSELTKTASSLREQVCKLKQQIMDHVNSGCQVMLSNNLVNL